MSAAPSDWIDVGAADELAASAVQEVRAGNARLALTCIDGRFGAVAGVCNHVGGPLGKGRLDGHYLVCPWHEYKFHRCTGAGEPGYEGDRVPSHAAGLRGRDAAGRARSRRPTSRIGWP